MSYFFIMGGTRGLSCQKEEFWSCWVMLPIDLSLSLYFLLASRWLLHINTLVYLKGKTLGWKFRVLQWILERRIFVYWLIQGAPGSLLCYVTIIKFFTFLHFLACRHFCTFLVYNLPLKWKPLKEYHFHGIQLIYLIYVLSMIREIDSCSFCIDTFLLLHSAHIWHRKNLTVSRCLHSEISALAELN